MNVVRSASVTYRPLAECVEEGCNFASNPSSQTRDMAKQHVDRTGHHVRVITETVDLYVPKEQ